MVVELIMCIGCGVICGLCLDMVGDLLVKVCVMYDLLLLVLGFV